MVVCLLCRVPATIVYIYLLLFSTFFNNSTSCSNGNCQEMEPCSSIKDCGSGLYCGNCPAVGKTQPICTRGQSNKMPTSYIGGLAFNKYSWLVTHNAFSIVDAPPALPNVQRLTFYNQEDSVTNQLRNGVRALMLDMYDFNDDIWLCHSFRGQCFNFTAFEPAINTLREVEAFLTENPTEIVTIIIEDYVHTPKGLSNLFGNADLEKYWFPVSKMPQNGEDWPNVNEMVQENQRLLVFTSIPSKEAEEGIAYQWKYMVENESGDPGVARGSCTNRKESQMLDSRTTSLFLMNYFSTYPVEDEACEEHSTPLLEMIGTCYKAAGNMMPNFVAVNYYMRSDGGGVFDALDQMNGQTLCGCTTLAACQDGASFGTCKNITLPTTSSQASTATTTGSGSFSGSVQLKSGSVLHSPSHAVFMWSCFGFLMFLLQTTQEILLSDT